MLRYAVQSSKAVASAAGTAHPWWWTGAAVATVAVAATAAASRRTELNASESESSVRSSAFKLDHVSWTPWLRTTRCEAPSESNATVWSSLQDLSTRLERLEQTVGHTTLNATPSTAPTGRIDVVLGAQWGDEGKGKLVDLLAAGAHDRTTSASTPFGYDVCARVAGGANAGHTIVVNGVTYKFHLLPSGILCPTTTCIIGNGVVVHLPSLLAELDRLEATFANNPNANAATTIQGRLWLSDRAHLVFDFHMAIDGIQERRLGKHSLGTTHKGIGPAYASKISRNGLRVSDLQDWPYFERRYRELCAAALAQYPELHESLDMDGQLAYYQSIAERVGAITCDTIAMTQEQYAAGKRILVEGANATMLDIDFGTYPYVTSSNPSIGSVLTGLGVAPQTIRGIYGTVKAYCTRVGAGPFPTELDTDQGPGRHLATVGVEVGTTTGRPRRTGWLDIPQMKYAALINGFTALNLTKLDVLTGLETIQIATGYQYKGQLLASMPASLTTLDQVEVVYETMPGWTENLSHCRSFDDLPVNAQRYVLRCQELIGVPIRWIGIGPGRDDIIDRGDGWDLS